MAKPKIHIYFAHYGDAGARNIEATAAGILPDYDIIVWHKPDQFREGLANARILLAFRPPTDCWHKAENLELLHNFGAGIDDLLPADDLPKRVKVANAKGLTAEPMSDFGLAQILALTKGLHIAVTNQKKATWQGFTPGDVRTQTVGILGLGAIGTPLARKAKALGYHVIGLNHKKRPNEHADETYGLDQLDTFLAKADIVVNLLPGTKETQNLIDRNRLDAMKPGSYLVNLGRGGTVEEAALIDKLEDGSIAGAAIDVFSKEPLPSDDPLWQAPNVILTPHLAGSFPNYLEHVLNLFADNVKRFEAGEPILTPVDVHRGY